MKKQRKIHNAHVTWDNKREVFRVHKILDDGSYQWFRNDRIVCLEEVRFVSAIEEGQLAALGTMVLPKQHTQNNDSRVWFEYETLQGGYAEKAMLMIHTGIKRGKVHNTPEVRLQGFRKEEG